MTATQIQKKFPNYYPACGVPPQAKEQDLRVYRVCIYGAIDKRAFYSHYELWKYEGTVLKGMDTGWEDIHFYSVSTFEDINDANKIHKLLSRRNPKAIMAVGNTCGNLGPCLRSKDECCERNSHVNWWLYEGAQPEKAFSEVKL